MNFNFVDVSWQPEICFLPGQLMCSR